MPVVSVLMTAYNRQDFIADAIQSALAQTFTDWELIIVDDCSHDRTVEIAKGYAAQDARIHVHVNERNLGDYPNRNHAATLADGQFIKYHDSDDLMYPHCLAVMVPLLTAYPQASFALHPGAREWSGGPCPMLLTPRLCYQREYLGMGMFDVGPACALFRTEFFRRVGGFPEVGPHSDHAFFLKVCATETVLLTPGNLFWYRIHAGQHLQTPGAAMDRVTAARQSWAALKAVECPLEPAQVELAKRNVAWHMGRTMIRHLCAGEFKYAVAYWRGGGLTLRDWLRYFRRQRRDNFAGTPRNGSGQFLMPDWSVYK
jgi:glycosyltransferase involved in cell wall biosynthesis